MICIIHPPFQTPLPLPPSLIERVGGVGGGGGGVPNNEAICIYKKHSCLRLRLRAKFRSVVDVVVSCFLCRFCGKLYNRYY